MFLSSYSKPFVLPLLSFALSSICLASGDTTSAALANDLRREGDGALAALEYRRMAADSDDAAVRGACYLLAADAYRSVSALPRMNSMLDHAEEEGALDSLPGAWMRVQAAEANQDWASAALYAEDLSTTAAGKDERLARHARRLAAADFLRAGAIDDARAALGDEVGAAAIDRYCAGHDKSPRLGGFLGIVPGLGYAYSGEWGNMFRSIFLNGIFGWAMFETADHDQWGLFAVSTFFELTWYTGSIYGGIDAAHRYNRRRLDDAVRELRGEETPALRPGARIDLFSLHLDF